MTTRNIQLVLTEPEPGSEDAYADWLGGHLDDALKLDGVVAARRYRLEPLRDGDTPLPADLTLYETTGPAVTPPAGPAKITNWCYEEVAAWRSDGDDRPVRDPYLFVVLTAPADGLEEEFNEWYTGRHLADVLKLPDYRSAQRYRFTGGDEPLRPYLAFYDTDSTDVRETQRRLTEVVDTPAMPFHPGIDRTQSMGLYYKPVTDRRTA